MPLNKSHLETLADIRARHEKPGLHRGTESSVDVAELLRLYDELTNHLIDWLNRPSLAKDPVTKTQLRQALGLTMARRS